MQAAQGLQSFLEPTLSIYILYYIWLGPLSTGIKGPEMLTGMAKLEV